MIKNTNTINKTAQRIHIKSGNVINSPFDFGRNECAIKPWIPKLKSKKLIVEVIIKKLLEYESFAIKRYTPKASAITITILNNLLDILLNV